MSERTTFTTPGAEPAVARPSGDTRNRISGSFAFSVDRRIEGALHAKAVRSVVPHGNLRGIDSSEAMAMPEVVAVIDGTMLREDPTVEPFHGENRADQPLLAIDKVRYVGEPVALVVARTRAAAERGAEAVFPDVQELPYVVDAEQAGEEGAPLVHEEWLGNDCGSWQLVHGDAEAAMASAYYVHRGVYRSPTQNHAAMEPHVATAAWMPDGSLEVWTGTQSPYVVRQRLAGVFGLDSSQVRVRGDALGGGFGSKLDMRLEGLVAFAARVVDAPVRMELRRDEVFMTSAKHAATVSMTTGVDREGVMVARTIDIVWNAGAYALSTPRASRTGMIRSPGPYRIPHVKARSVARYTNTVPTGPFRGAMTGQICWAHESALDEIAAELSLDPVEVRRRNLLRDDDVFATGDVMHDFHYHRLLDDVADALHWTERSTPSTSTVARGKGVAAVLKTTRTPSRSEAAVQVSADGAITVRSSSVEMGQGAARSLAELAAGRLGLTPELVSVAVPDTLWTPFDQTTSSSRTTFAMGLTVERATDDMRRRLDALVASHWGVSPDGLLHADGRVLSGEDPTRSISYAEVVSLAPDQVVVGQGEYETPPGAGQLDPDTSQGNASVHFHQGVVGVEVEVDRETGRVKVVHAHGAVFAGRLVDADRARKQVEGGLVFGLGQAVMEELTFDAGQPTNPNFSDYQIPSILDAPRTTSFVLADEDPTADPHGIGESTVPPMAPAVANAIWDAVGVRVRDLPVTAEKVLRGLQERGQE
jgi:CO/xanthine dehydrogenase Mo-binding subunit